MKKIKIGGLEETVVERSDYSMEKVQKILEKETICTIGYGVQGHGQSLNLRDNGIEVIIGQRRGGKGWSDAIRDGWEPGKNLFDDLEDVADRSTLLLYLLSDAGQKEQWPRIKPHLRSGDALCFSHGFSITYQDQTAVVPPKFVDVFLVAPKGSGTTVRRFFVEGKGINASYAIEQDHTGRARERCLALGIAIGSGYLFETNFKNEVYSDLTGERGVLMGAIYGLWLAQYEVLRAKGHSPSEAFNETVEEATQSLYPLIAENGMDWMYANCSTTAQRGAIDWYRRFRDANLPVFQELYEKVARGDETRRALETNSAPDYREKLEKELATIRESEMWQVGKILRELRPERRSKDRLAKEKA